MSERQLITRYTPGFHFFRVPRWYAANAGHDGIEFVNTPRIKQLYLPLKRKMYILECVCVWSM